MSIKLTLEEQRDFLQRFVTNGPKEYQAKKVIFQTLNGLIALRRSLEGGPDTVNSDKFAEDLAAVLGESPTMQVVKSYGQ